MTQRNSSISSFRDGDGAEKLLSLLTPTALLQFTLLLFLDFFSPSTFALPADSKVAFTSSNWPIIIIDTFGKPIQVELTNVDYRVSLSLDGKEVFATNDAMYHPSISWLRTRPGPRPAEAGGEKCLAMYEDGNHVCNNIPYKCRPLVADWIRERLTA